MASQAVGNPGADADAQYAECSLIRSLKHAEEKT